MNSDNTRRLQMAGDFRMLARALRARATVNDTRGFDEAERCELYADALEGRDPFAGMGEKS